jgi:hypothetical protein
MSSQSMLKWPFITAALFAASLVCLASPGRAGLLLSRTQTAELLSRADLERELVIDALVSAGWSRHQAAARVAVLTDPEIRRLADAGMTLAAGGENGESGRAFRVGLVIVVVLAFITGIYLFAEAD